MSALPHHHESIAKQEVEALAQRVADAAVLLAELRRMLAIARMNLAEHEYVEHAHRSYAA